jgi:hypothetical protein
MAVTLKVLNAHTGASSALTAATFDISTSASGKGWLVKNIYFYNNSSATMTVDLVVKYASGYRMLKKAAASLTAGAIGFVERDITLDRGTDTLAASVSVPSGSINFDYVINGIERDQ